MLSKAGVWDRARRAAHAVFLCCGLPALFQSPAVAASSVTLQWDPSPGTNIAGYKIYYGPTSLTYTNVIDVGLTTNTTVSSLITGATYFFAATAYDTWGLESDYSGEVIYTNQAMLPPTIVLAAPANGANYAAPATINLSATVTANGHSITGVRFYSGATPFATSDSEPYTATLTNVGASSYLLTAQAVYDSGSTVASAPVNVIVAAARPADMPPTISAIPDQSICTTQALLTVPFTADAPGSTASSLAFGASSTNQALLPNSGIAITGSDTNCAITLSPVSGQTGEADITVTVSSVVSGLTTNTTFHLTVTAQGAWSSDGDWSDLNSGVNGPVYAMAASGADLYVAGGFTTAGGVAANHVAKWNGSVWAALGSGMNDVVTTLAVSGTNLYAGGRFTTAGGRAASKVARWDGSAWSALGSGINGQGVVNLAVLGTDLYAGGMFTAAGGTAAANIAKWNGSTWSALGSGVGGGDGVNPTVVAALAVSGTTVYAGGNFTTAGGVAANYVAKWNGSAWSALGSGMNQGVFALAASGTNLYAGGRFTTANGVTANNVAKWNGSTWSALSSGVRGGDGVNPSAVVALAVSGTDLYVGGEFTSAGDTAANYVAKWNGSAWSALGSVAGGDHPSVNALAVSVADLYVGGEFTTAGNRPSANVARTRIGLATPWPEATDLGGGWMWSSWFGFFNTTYYPWIWHETHGWMYVFGTDPASILLWTPNMGYLWTGSGVYPWLWRNQEDTWLYYVKGSQAPRWFFNWNAQHWESHNP